MVQFINVSSGGGPLSGYIDIPYAELKEAVDRAEKKEGVCKVLPQGRFGFGCRPKFDYLVCCPSDMGGSATGTGAAGCKNCQQGKSK